jgi:hypothetical protein
MPEVTIRSDAAMTLTRYGRLGESSNDPARRYRAETAVRFSGEQYADGYRQQQYQSELPETHIAEACE